MKKILALVLGILMVLSVFAGCSQPASEPSDTTAPADTNEPSQSTEPTKIVYWYARSEAAGEAVAAAVDEFNATIGAEKNIVVEAIYQGSAADSTTKMRAVMQGGDASQLPDLMEIDATGILDYRTSEYAFSVDEALALDPDYDISQISEAALKNWYYAGTQWGLPFTITTHVLFYNKTMLDAANITEAPTTFEEIKAVAAALPEKNENGQDLTAYGCLPSSIYLAYWFGQIPSETADASYVVNNRNGRDDIATELVCDKEGTLVKFLTAWKDLYDSGALLNSGSGLQEMFATEQISMFTGDTANIVSLLEQINGRFELGCAFFPRIDDSCNFGNQVSGSALCMFNKGDDAKVAAAWELMKYMTSAEPQANLAVASGYIPCNSGSYELDNYVEYSTTYPQVNVGPEQLAITSPDDVGINVGPSINFYLDVQEKISTMLTDNLTPEETASIMAESLNAMLADYVANNQ